MWVFHHTALLWEDLTLSRRLTSSNCFSLPAFLISPASLGEFFCHILNLKWPLILQTFFFLTVLKRCCTKTTFLVPSNGKGCGTRLVQTYEQTETPRSHCLSQGPICSWFPGSWSWLPGVTSHTTVTTGAEESGAWGAAAWRSEWGAQRAQRPAALGVPAHRCSLPSAFSSRHM